MFVTLEFDANLVVVDTQVTVAVTNHRLRHHLLHFLRHDADIGAVAAVILKRGRSWPSVQSRMESHLRNRQEPR